jgi:hypothetical protein
MILPLVLASKFAAIRLLPGPTRPAGLLFAHRGEQGQCDGTNPPGFGARKWLPKRPAS